MHSLVIHNVLTSLINTNLFSSLFSELRSSSCGNPGVPSKGILNGTLFNVGDKIRYRCVTGYVLDGHSLLTCVTNAAGVSLWDFPVPICRGEEVLSLKIIIINCDICFKPTFSWLYCEPAGCHREDLMLSSYCSVPPTNLK